MNMDLQIEDSYKPLIDTVKLELSVAAHDMEHVMRVYKQCLHLVKFEDNVDIHVLKTAAILHDIARAREDNDPSRTIDHASLGAKMSEEILHRLDYSKDQINQITHCIRSHRFRESESPETVEAKILFDADKLDVLGPVGIARSFMISGAFNQSMYVDTNLDEYIKGNLLNGKPDGRIIDVTKHSPNLEFENKFRRIPGRLYTQKGREIGQKRLDYMEKFFLDLKKQLDGEL
jgi:uncharacterized protein